MGVRAALVASFLLAAPSAFGTEARVGDIAVADAWARPTPPTLRVAAVYLTITNHGTRADLLTGIVTPQAETAEIHETTEKSGVMQMRQVTSIECPPGAKLNIAPGGIHIMLVGLKRPLAVNSQFPLTLSFRDAGSVTLNVVVEARE